MLLCFAATRYATPMRRATALADVCAADIMLQRYGTGYCLLRADICVTIRGGKRR